MDHPMSLLRQSRSAIISDPNDCDSIHRLSVTPSIAIFTTVSIIDRVCDGRSRSQRMKVKTLCTPGARGTNPA
jgi:hypothetical protein